MKYCIIPGYSTLYTDFIHEISTIDSELFDPVILHDLRYMNSNLLLINRFVNFFFVILYVDIYNLISWLQNDKSIIKIYDFIQNIPHSYDKLSHIYNNITFGF